MSVAGSAGRPGTVRILTWNIWWRFGDAPDERAAAIAETLADAAADIACLQEVYSDSADHDGERLADRLGFEMLSTPRVAGRDKQMHNVILSRWPVAESGCEALPGADGAPGVRRALWARIAAPSGPIVVIGTHLAYRFDESALRERQLTHILHLADRLRDIPAEESAPIILAGDLNAVPDSDEIRLLTGRRAGPIPNLVFTDCWPQVGADPGHTWVRRNPHLATATWPERRLDYIMTSWPRSKSIGRTVAAHLVGEGRPGSVWPSDHLGVAVDLTTGALPV